MKKLFTIFAVVGFLTAPNAFAIRSLKAAFNMYDNWVEILKRGPEITKEVDLMRSTYAEVIRHFPEYFEEFYRAVEEFRKSALAIENYPNFVGVGGELYEIEAIARRLGPKSQDLSEVLGKMHDIVDAPYIVGSTSKRIIALADLTDGIVSASRKLRSFERASSLSP